MISLVPCDHCGAMTDPLDMSLVEGMDLCPRCTGEVSREEAESAFVVPFPGEHTFITEPLIGLLAKAGIALYDGRNSDERCVPRWAAQTGSSVLSVVWFIAEPEVVSALRKVSENPGLQQALAGGRAVGASGMDLFWMIQEWDEGG